jgi:hypothetical protein
MEQEGSKAIFYVGLLFSPEYGSGISFRKFG